MISAVDVQNSDKTIINEEVQALSFPGIEDVIREVLENIVTLLCSNGQEKSRVYEEVLLMVERNLIKIALKRSNNVKTGAADLLGINRNTLHKKMNKLGINHEKE
jgi:DNA-binding protein Fis